MTKLLRVPFNVPVGDHRIIQPVVTRAGEYNNLEIFLRENDEGHNRVVSVELSPGAAAKLHGDLTRALSLDTPTIEYEEVTLAEILQWAETFDSPITFILKPGLELDRVMEIPKKTDILDTFRYIGETYGYSIIVRPETIDVERDGKPVGSITRAYEITIDREFGRG